MSSDLQSLLALGIVAVTAVLLVRSAIGKRHKPGCDCGAVSPEMKKFQTRLKR